MLPLLRRLLKAVKAPPPGPVVAGFRTVFVPARTADRANQVCARTRIETFDRLLNCGMALLDRLTAAEAGGAEVLVCYPDGRKERVDLLP